MNNKFAVLLNAIYFDSLLVGQAFLYPRHHCSIHEQCILNFEALLIMNEKIRNNHSICVFRWG
jgi:hypothetical protein